MFLAESDFGDDINFTIQDKDGFAKNLTGINTRFQVWRRGMVPFIDQDCIIVNATGGLCKYNVKETDFRTGVFYAKVLLKMGSSKHESTERFLMVVQE